MGLSGCGGVNISPLAERVVGIEWDMWCSGGEYMMLGDDWQVLEGYKCARLSSGASRAISASEEKKAILVQSDGGRRRWYPSGRDLVFT